MTSSTARSAKAFSHTNDGNRDSKTFSQESRQYLIVSMGHEAHGNLSLVFSKPKRQWGHERAINARQNHVHVSYRLTLAAALDRRFLAIPAVVLPFLMLHAVRGWCPPVPLFRRMGVRTQREIDREIFALKTLRGDFDDVRRQTLV